MKDFKFIGPVSLEIIYDPDERSSTTKIGTWSSLSNNYWSSEASTCVNFKLKETPLYLFPITTLLDMKLYYTMTKERM